MTVMQMSEPPREARFWDKIAAKYAAIPVSDEESYRTKLAITQAYLRRDMDVLEFGCGTGTTALHLAPFVGHYRGTDISARMIEIAREKAWERSPGNVTFDQESIEGAVEERERYDVILGHSILHLVEDPGAVIAKVEAMLKPGGVFISSTACIREILPVFGLIAPVGRWLGLIPFVKIFRQSDLTRDLTAAGFELEKVWQPKRRASVFIVARKPG